MKEKREAMGLSLRDASKLSGVSHTHIRDIEDGRSTPSFEMVMKFLKAYMVDIRSTVVTTGCKFTVRVSSSQGPSKKRCMIESLHERGCFSLFV